MTITMIHRRSLALFPLLALAACQPRPAPANAPVPVVQDAVPEEELLQRLARARRHFEEGVALGRQSRWTEAAERYRLASEADPRDPRYPLALAEAFASMRRAGDAADALAAAIRIEEGAPRPNHRVLYVDYERLIRWLEQAGRLDEARSARQRQEHHRRMRDAAG